jgi:hypothetical protein
MAAPITEFVDVTVNLQGAVAADKFGFSSQLGAFTHTVTAGSRQDGPYFSIAEVVAAGFIVSVTPTIHAWASRVFDQENGIDRVLIGRIEAADATLTASLDAIEAADPSAFYFLNIESRADADIALATAWAEARNGSGGIPRKICLVQSNDLTAVAFLAMQAANYNRSSGIYHAADAEYLDGAWTSKGGGFNLDGPEGVGTWSLKPLQGVPFDPVTGAEATALYAANANLYGRLSGLNFTSKGTMASGRRIDVQTTLDWVVVRIEEAVLSAFVGTPTNIPYTNAGVNRIAATIQGVLNSGITFGHFAPVEDSLPGAKPEVQAPNVLTLSSAQKQTRSVVMTATATLAGAIEKLELTLNVFF